MAKYTAQLFVRIVIVSQNYCATFVTVRAYTEILNDKQILLSANMKFGKRVQNMFTSFALKYAVKKRRVSSETRSFIRMLSNLTFAR